MAGGDNPGDDSSSEVTDGEGGEDGPDAEVTPDEEPPEEREMSAGEDEATEPGPAEEPLEEATEADDEAAETEPTPPQAESQAEEDGGEAAKPDRAVRTEKAESPVWQDSSPYRGSIRTNGENGRAKEYREWDHTHNDIETYDRHGFHTGSRDPVTGDRTKPAKPGRRLDNV